jgi:prevent-host-death family protein
MAETVNIHEAKTRLSKLLRRVQLGEEIVIAKAGRPVARLAPLAERVSRRTPGSAKGLISLSANFDAPLPRNLQKTFEA